MSKISSFSSHFRRNSDTEEDPIVQDDHVESDSQMSNRLAIAWINLNLYLSTELNEPKHILQNVSGFANFGTMTALMGPSGVGKSSLLKCLNGFHMTGVHKDSEIYLGSEIRSCFVIQNICEHLLAGLTAIQSLIYASKLKNCGQNVDHKQIAYSLLDILDLADIADNAVEVCSGGEQKRLAIALELTESDKPNLLCVDEPTSGLDSNAAVIVINALKNLTRNYNIAVITSIHQPNNEIVFLFDNLYVLAKGGLCVYDGPSEELRSYLRNSQICCTGDQVPIEVLIKFCSKTDVIQQLADNIRQKRNSLRNRALIEGQLSSNVRTNKRIGFNLKHMWYLLTRETIRSIRSQKITIGFKFLTFVFLSLLLVLIINKHVGQPDACLTPIGYKLFGNQTCIRIEEQLIHQNISLHFFTIIMAQFLLIISSYIIFIFDYKIFINEKRNGWYSTGSFFWAKTIVEIPLTLINILAFSTIIYKLTDQKDDKYRFVGYLAIMYVNVLNAEGIGAMIGLISSDENLAMVMTIGIHLLSFTLSGYFVPISQLPKSISWATYLSYCKPVFEMVITTVYGFDRCPDGSMSLVLCQMDIIEQYKFWLDMKILLAQTIMYRISLLIILMIKANKVQ